MSATSPRTPYDAIRPYAILAVAAFVLGFAGYLALDRPTLAAVTASGQPGVIAEPAADPAAIIPASDDWNIPKKI